MNAVLPFESCAMHIGTAPFGRDGRMFSDLPMRAYVIEGPSKSVIGRISTAGSGQARTFKRVADASVETPTSIKAWNLTSLVYTTGGSDYRAHARIDFFTAESGPQTAALVFMYSPSTRWPWDRAISDIVSSFSWRQ